MVYFFHIFFFNHYQFVYLYLSVFQLVSFHFVWTSLNGGTCWMKTGTVAQSDAVEFAWVGSFCGIQPKPGQ
jgi:hypothetical protein